MNERPPGSFALAEEALGPGSVALVASGELDAATASQLRDGLNAAVDAGVKRLVIDLSDVSFIDSVSVATIVSARRRLADAGRLAVVVKDPYVLLIFQAGGLEDVLHVVQAREDADAHAAS